MSFCSESSIIIEAGQRLASVTTRGRRLGRGQSRLASDCKQNIDTHNKIKIWGKLNYTLTLDRKNYLYVCLERI